MSDTVVELRRRLASCDDSVLEHFLDFDGDSGLSVMVALELDDELLAERLLIDLDDFEADSD